MRIWTMMAAALVFLGGAMARAAPPPAEQQVRKRCAALTRGINARDLKQVRSCYSRQLRVRGARGTTRGYGQVLYSMAATFKKYPKFRTSLDVQKVVVRGDKAYCTASYRNSGIGKRPEAGRCNMVWKRQGGTWLLASLDRA